MVWLLLMILPESAQVVIIGGGICGASLLYHLAHEGWTDTLLIEKAELTSGSTWHAAGQVTHSVSSYTLGYFRKYGCELYASLEAESGIATSWHKSGSLRVAYEPIEVDWLKSQLGVADYVGNHMEWVSGDFIAARHPFYEVDEIIGAVWTPDDGHVDPSGATNALISVARAKGAQVSRRNRVLEINRCSDGSFEVVTEQGRVRAEHVVNAAGCYAHQVAQMVGLSVPMANALHSYLITDVVAEFAELDQELPVMRDDYISGYVRQEQQSGLIGIYEQRNAEAAWPDGPAWSLENPLFPADFDRIGFWLARAFERVPVLEPVGIKQVIRGAIAHTPDGEPMLGPSGIPNYWMMAGVQVGIADGPGLGRELARWMVHGETEVSVRGYDARRFGFVPADDAENYGRIKGTEDYEYRHQTPVPELEHPELRPYRTTPLYERFADKGAVFTQVYGWERPKWYPTVAGLPQRDVVAFRHTDWFEVVTQECRAVRERVGILDSTAFAKFDLIGPDAAEVLDQLTTNTLPRIGRIGLSYFLTPTGRIEGEATITRLAEDHFYVVSAAVGEQKDREYFETHWPSGARAELHVRSDDLGVLAVAGPAARELLGRCTSTDLHNAAFPWLSAAPITVAGCAVWALRVGFVGELGWELHAPTGDLGTIYDMLWDAGQDLGVANIGNHALDSLRMEKQYMISRDLTHDVGPDEAGLHRFVKVDKGPFVGRDALLARRAQVESGERPYRWKLAYLAIDSDNADVHGSDGIYCNGEPVGLITSGAYGHHVKQGLGFAYLAPERAAAGTELRVRVVGEPRPARVLDKPIYDPNSSRLRM
ncbi:MAG: FAD-dependent oxidoreductase [Acidimicrobiaceae bacterium]|nr:FAD-dependent oxidoreductase [Acidimicrobiaceae bacterium]MYA74065.1 FAD-dependent oxidoreductase [Acidimicrobiaceae bacterium]MYD06302.1 FAD-dependent oxidoreductase [Acidimicrobiaceae bacterium]MYG55336.1 FAD-dependent oxidoreductase [Acidimicrobiaceae bacterium]MYI59309.1 FAD-dependent oxidoreductase [Acidimicrobiaceae bacterium]